MIFAEHIPIKHWGRIDKTSHLRPIYLRPKCSQQFPLHKINNKREVSTMSAELHFPMAVFDYLYKCECPQFPSFSIAKCVLARRMYVHRQGSSTCKNWQSWACTGGSSTPLATSYQNISLAHSTGSMASSIDGVAGFSRFTKVVCLRPRVAECARCCVFSDPFLVWCCCYFSLKESLAHLVVMRKED